MPAIAGYDLAAEADVPAEAAPLGAEFAAIYREHCALVWRGLRRLGVADAALEDAVQDVFLVAHRRAGDFAHRSSLRTWLFGIVVRVAKDYRRSRSRHLKRVASYAEELRAGPAPAPSPAEEAERREASRVLYAVLATLDDELREVLVLVELEELPLRDAAKALDLRVRTCQRRLRAAHAAFEAALQHHLQSHARPA